MHCEVPWVVTRASLASQCVAVTLVLASHRTKPGKILPFSYTRGLSSAAIAVRSSAQSKILSTLTCRRDDPLVVSGSPGRRRLGAADQVAAAKAKGLKSVMGDHDQDRAVGNGFPGGAGSTSPLQAYLERSFAAVTRSATASSAHDRREATEEDTAKDMGLVVHAYSGNEACDADSICSAIGAAFLEDSLQAAVGVGDGSRPRVQHVPVMPIPRADLALRREVLLLFEMCGVDPSALAFIDDIDLPALQAEGRLRLTLMDHNAVSGSLNGLGDAVIEIVDHHMDLGKHRHVRGRARDIAFAVQDGAKQPLVGSCCTLVAEKMLERAPDVLSAGVARLLLGVILIDTNNIDLAAGRATPRDMTAAEQLSNRSLSSSKSERSGPTKALFDTLRNAKFDPGFWDGLSARDCLRYDYKQFVPSCGGGGVVDDEGKEEQRSRKFGMSSILCRVETLSGKPGASAAMREFALERGLDCLAVMTTTLDGVKDGGDIRKELLVYVESEKRSEQIREFLESSPQVAFLRLRRKGVPSPDYRGFCSDGNSNHNEGWFLWWEMGNAVPSRKQIAPVIISFYESFG